MSSGRSRFALFLTAMGALLAAVFVASAQSGSSSALPRRGRAIQFSNPRSSVVSSNVNELGANKTKLEDLEQQLRKPFEIFGSGDDSINRVATPVRRLPPSAAKMRQMKELLEKRKEWIFLAPEDYVEPGLTTEEMLDVPEYGTDGTEKKRKTPIERYYERLEKARAEARAAVTNQSDDDSDLGLVQRAKAQADVSGVAKTSDFGQPKSFSPGLDAVEKTLKQWQSVPENSILNPSTAETTTGNSFSDLFGFGKIAAPAPGSEQALAREARMQKFKELLEPHSTAMFDSGAPAFTPPALPSLTPPADFGASPGVAKRSSPISPPPSSSAPGLVPTSANPALPSWQTQPPEPKAPALKLPPPGFNIPQRKF